MKRQAWGPAGLACLALLLGACSRQAETTPAATGSSPATAVPPGATGGATAGAAQPGAGLNGGLGAGPGTPASGTATNDAALQGSANTTTRSSVGQRP